MRESSTTWTVTCHPLPSSGSSPSTASTGWPSSSGNSRRTRWTASRPDIWLRELRPFWLRLERCSAIGLLLRCVCADGEPLQQSVLPHLALLLVDQPVLEVEVEL